MLRRRNIDNNIRDTSMQSHLSKYRRFAIELEGFLEDELASCRSRPRNETLHSTGDQKGKRRIEEQKLRTMVCNEVLSKLLELQPVSSDLLTVIKSEYEKFISVLSHGQVHFDYLQEEIKKSHTDPFSLVLLQKRKAELTNRIAILSENNKRLMNQLDYLNQSLQLNTETESNQTGIEDDSKNLENDYIKKQPAFDVKGGKHNHNNTVLRKMSLPAAMDLGKLIKYSAKLQTKIQKLKSNLMSEYISKSRLEELKDQLRKKENTQYHLKLYNTRLQERFENLKLALEPLQSVASGKPVTMSKMVNRALEDHRKLSPGQMEFQNFEVTGILEDDDPAKKQEAESLMEYMDTFNEMLNNENYEQAAKHAANSPKGILRSFDTMKTFKQIDAKRKDGISTAMMFCEALMATAENSEKLSGGLSCEVLKCALNKDRLDLVSHWLSKNCFSPSLPMGNMLIENCKCKRPCLCGNHDLAKEIFSSIGAHRQASLCLLATGKIHQMISYGEDHNFSASDYVYLCKQYPSTKLILFLLSAHADENIPGLITFPMAISILLQSDNKQVLSEILQDIFVNGLVSVDGKRKTLTDLLLAETVNDQMSKSKWEKVIEFCCEQSLDEIALDLLSVITVREAIDTAAYKYLMDYIS